MSATANWNRIYSTQPIRRSQGKITQAGSKCPRVLGTKPVRPTPFGTRVPTENADIYGNYTKCTLRPHKRWAKDEY